MNVEFALKDAVQLLGFIGSLVVVYVNLNSRIVKLESLFEGHRENATEMKALLSRIDRKLSEITDRLTSLETMEKMRG
jgi:phosphopentomutase